jgi:predicted transcriptional regulator
VYIFPAVTEGTKFIRTPFGWYKMVNRDRHEITLEILRRTTVRKKKTEIMRDVGLSYSQAKQYLNELMNKGLLQIDEKHNFKTTRKGLEFLQKCEACPLFDWDREKLKSLF